MSFNTSEDQFFHIDLDLLKDRKLFPFHVYVYHPVAKEYHLFLGGNDPLIKDKEEILRFIFEKGGSIAIRLAQKNTFLTVLGLKENEVPSLNKSINHHLVEEQQRLVLELISKRKEEAPFHLNQAFGESMKSDNFMPLIERVKEEIQCFSITHSHTVSLARALAETFLNEDTITNRIVCISYLLAKGMDIRDQDPLSDLFCAAFFHHIGKTQLETSILKQGQIRLAPEDQKRQQQHPGLSHHLIKKSQIDLSQRCLTILEEHHELADGSGYPGNKMAAHLDILSLVLGAVSHIFELHAGMVTGKKVPLSVILHHMKNKSPYPGLELHFGDVILANLAHLQELTTHQQQIAKSA